MIITLSGMPGSGKSTAGRLLAERLGYKFYSMGDLRGKMAMDRGMTIDELNETAKKESSSHSEVDEYQKKLGQTEDNFVIDGWISFHFIPHSFKIFLDADSRVASERIFASPRPDEAVASSVEEVRSRLEKRVEITDAQFMQYYGISFRDRSKFDLVIDTTHQTPEETVAEILTALSKASK